MNKVFKMDDYEWWATKLDKEETCEYYMKEYGLSENDVVMEDIIECDLDIEGMWWETEDIEDLEKLGDADEIVNYKTVYGRKIKRVQFGDLMRSDGKVFKFIPFREALQKHGDFTEPFCLASTEW